MLASRVGFEPTTKGLKVPCSATELPARSECTYRVAATSPSEARRPRYGLEVVGKSPSVTSIVCSFPFRSILTDTWSPGLRCRSAPSMSSTVLTGVSPMPVTTSPGWIPA